MTLKRFGLSDIPALPRHALVWSSPCGWQARQDHALSFGSLRLLDRQSVARMPARLIKALLDARHHRPLKNMNWRTLFTIGTRQKQHQKH